MATRADDWSYIGQTGINGNLDDWLSFNLSAIGIQEQESLLSAFPPTELMQVTTGLTMPLDFATHGVHFVEQLKLACPTPLRAFASILDFGCGVGRLARMFKGFAGKYTGIDIDERTVDWVRDSLPHVSANLSRPHHPLPLPDNSFDCVISISVFTHLTEIDHVFYLKELQRVTQPGAILLLTVHGSRAVRRALTEEFIFNLVWCPRDALEQASVNLESGDGYRFIRQLGHLTTDSYDYGITFIGEEYIRRIWSTYFDVLDVRAGAIHDFQDIVVLRRR